jgi:hypothetical protein
MKPLNRLYRAAAFLMISLHAIPASADSAHEGTLVRLVDGRVQLGATRSPRSDRAVEDAVAKMSALRTQGADRFWSRNHENVAFPPLRPITARMPTDEDTMIEFHALHDALQAGYEVIGSTPQGYVVRLSQADGEESYGLVVLTQDH